MLRATSQFTIAPGRPTPEPATAPETTCVVESGKPTCEEARMTEAATVSDPKPCGGRASTTFVASVLLMGPPPAEGAGAVAAAAEVTTHPRTREPPPPGVEPVAVSAREV